MLAVLTCGLYYAMAQARPYVTVLDGATLIVSLAEFIDRAKNIAAFSCIDFSLALLMLLQTQHTTHGMHRMNHRFMLGKLCY